MSALRFTPTSKNLHKNINVRLGGISVNSRIMTTRSFSGVELPQLLAELRTGATGLTAARAAELLEAQKHALKTPPRWRRNLKLLLRQYTNPLVLLLVGAVVVSAVLGQTTDVLIIGSILLATGLLGFWQELGADRAVEKLQQMLQLTCRVLRDGQEMEVPANEAVPGDIILFAAGDIIPADCRVMETNEMHVNESAMTGESFPIEKFAGVVADDSATTEKTNCLWKGSSIVTGTGKAVVVHTGLDTLFGEMAQSLSHAEESAFEKGIRKFGYFLMQVTLFLCVFILCVNIYFHKPLFDSLLFSLAIAVGMAPELLPAIMTFAMSVGAKNMLAKKVIVKKLSSIFNFGEVGVLCTDKTGTITQGIIEVDAIVDAADHPSDKAKLYACINAVFQNGFGNPIDAAMRKIPADLTGCGKVDEIPYDFMRKRLTIVFRNADGLFMTTKGAVNNILDLCTSVEYADGRVLPIAECLPQIRKTYEAYCNSGLRAIAVAGKSVQSDSVTHADEADLVFLGLVLLRDPLKANIGDALDKLRGLHVGVKIITGDNRFIAAYTAAQIGIPTPNILTGGEMNKMVPEALMVKARTTDVFAEVEPSQKEQIIKALQKSGLVVAYMGDGINDVAAIHAADVGISIDNAVDVAKQAADFVLLENDLSVLADGIHEGRKTFLNTLKYVFINTGATFGNMFSVAGSSLLLPFLPMLPKQILLTNFITDFPFMAVASDNVDEDGLKVPGKWDLKFIRKFMVIFGLHSSLFDFATFFFQRNYLHLEPAAFQTGWFVESCITQLIILFIIRTRKPFFRSRPGKWLMIISAMAALVVLVLPVIPAGAWFGLVIADSAQILGITIIIVVYAVTADLLKRVSFR
jgi:P-type Mg2+ transporter